MKYTLTIICDEDFEMQIQAVNTEETNHAFLVFSNNQNTSCKVISTLNTPNAHSTITILAIIHNEHKVTIDGQISIEHSWSNTSWHLQEEILILGNQSYTLTKPILDVKNNNVSASHGAKVHRIDKQQLFYLTSRWLNEDQAKKIIISWLIYKLFEPEDLEIKIVWPSLYNQEWSKEDLMGLILSTIIW
jgi:Fe-S cluster assembly scaffold protein SufB